MQRIDAAGIDSRFVSKAILPSWWTAECEADGELLPDVEFMVARFLDAPLALVRDPSVPLALPSHTSAQLKAGKGRARPELAAAIHATERVLAATIRSLRAVPREEELLRDPREWRQLLTRDGAPPSLATVTADLWRLGIPVVPIEVLPAGKRFMALATKINGRGAIAIAHADDAPARLLFWLAHEAGHLANGDCDDGVAVVDAEEARDQGDEREVAADRFALLMLSGSASGLQLRKRGAVAMAAEAETLGGQQDVDAGHLVLSSAENRRRAGDKDAYAEANLALRELWLHQGGQAELRRQFDEHVDLLAANEDDRSLLRCVRLDPGPDARSG